MPFAFFFPLVLFLCVWFKIIRYHYWLGTYTLTGLMRFWMSTALGMLFIFCSTFKEPLSRNSFILWLNLKPAILGILFFHRTLKLLRFLRPEFFCLSFLSFENYKRLLPLPLCLLPPKQSACQHSVVPDCYCFHSNRGFSVASLRVPFIENAWDTLHSGFVCFRCWGGALWEGLKGYFYQLLRPTRVNVQPVLSTEIDCINCEVFLFLFHQQYSR